ncbi:MAG: hypothetical protein LC793_15895 [Thermomicrobia bacterium]|nr:hypothetical protein [Thermomicrobia bacterium]
MPDEEELIPLREEIETLAAFLHALQREHAQLQADFAAVLHAIGDQIELSPTALQISSRAQRLQRTEDAGTGAVTFRLRYDG